MLTPLGTLKLRWDGATGLTAERAYWLAWSRIKDVGPVTIKRLWEHFGSLAEAWQAPAGELLAVDGIGLLSAEKIVALRPNLNPEALLVKHEQENAAFWTPADAGYPVLLFAINDPPPVLYYRGGLRLNERPTVLTVGMVGTRRPSAYGKRWTQRLSSALTRQGAIVISGLAAGIDTEAHTSCLNNRGLTVAVLGTGVDVVYPKHNQSLYERIVQEGGLVVSEYPDGTGPDRAHFPQRNRIIAGLSRAILVTEAPARSGALITSRLANDYGREVYALPSSLDNVQGMGCLQAIEQGAQMILGEQLLVETLAELPVVEVRSPHLSINSSATHSIAGVVPEPDQVASNETAADPSATSGPSVPAPSLVAQPIPELSPVLSQVLAAVPIEPAVLDYIVPLTQVNPGEVLGALVQLELMGLVTQLPGMHYQRAC
ncbi:MAG: DNA-processing protein DprA [Cyanobacteria bacterium J06560_5]